MANVPTNERRKQLVEAASRVISKKGVSSATTRAIAAEAGAALASLHYAFGSKEELFIELLRWSTTFNQEVLNEAIVPPGSGILSAAQKIVSSWLAVDRPLVFAQFDIILWSMRTEFTESEAANLYANLTEQVAQILKRAARPQETNADFRRIAVRLLIICDGIQFGMLCAGPTYVSEAEAAAIVEGAVMACLKVKKDAKSSMTSDA